MTRGAAGDTDIELRLLIEAIYLKYHYDFRDYARASLTRVPSLLLNDDRTWIAIW